MRFFIFLSWFEWVVGTTFSTIVTLSVAPPTAINLAIHGARGFPPPNLLLAPVFLLPLRCLCRLPGHGLLCILRGPNNRREFLFCNRYNS